MKTPFQQAQRIGWKHFRRIIKLGQGTFPAELRGLRDVVLTPIGPDSTCDLKTARVGQAIYDAGIVVRGACILEFRKGGPLPSEAATQATFEIIFMIARLIAVTFGGMREPVVQMRVEPYELFVLILEDYTWISVGKRMIY